MNSPCFEHDTIYVKSGTVIFSHSNFDIFPNTLYFIGYSTIQKRMIVSAVFYHLNYSSFTNK